MGQTMHWKRRKLSNQITIRNSAHEIQEIVRAMWVEDTGNQGSRVKCHKTDERLRCKFEHHSKKKTEIIHTTICIYCNASTLTEQTESSKPSKASPNKYRQVFNHQAQHFIHQYPICQCTNTHFFKWMNKKQQEIQIKPLHNLWRQEQRSNMDAGSRCHEIHMKRQSVPRFAKQTTSARPRT